MLLCSLSPLYVTFRDTILYSRDTRTVEEGYDALQSKKKFKHLAEGSKSQAKGLVARGRRQDRKLSKNMRDRSKSRHTEKTCHYCKKNGHIRPDYYALKNINKALGANDKEKCHVDSAEANIVENDQSVGQLLVICDMGSKPCEEQVMDSTCTFYMCPNSVWFTTYEG